MTIREIMRGIVGVDESGQSGGFAGISFLATAESVDAAQYSCTVKIVGSNGTLENVRLKAEFQKDYGLVAIPKKGSFVVVTALAGGGGSCVSLCSEVEKIECVVGNFECVMEKNKISVKNGSYSLKKAFDDLFAAITKLTVTTGVGPSGTPINIAEFQAVQQNLNNLLQ